MKLRSIILLFTLLALGSILKAQDSIDNPVKKLFYDQLSLFPQEKIYVQTDKSEYLTGETIWFRVHLVDAVLLKQANASRYVYVELVSPMNHLVQRVKLRPDSTGCFYGNIETEQELGEGNYLMRAYTRVMQNTGEDYFFTKAIYIANPISERVSGNIKYHTSGSSINAEIHFFSKFENKEMTPDRCVVSLDENNTAKEKEVSFKEKIGRYYFSEKEIIKERTFQLKAEFNGKIYKKYYKIPYLNKAFDVSFFPEGGYAPVGTTMKMAFKSINSNGLFEDVKGQVYDDQDQLCREFETTHLGMGSFNMYYAPGKKYYAVCTNKENVSKRFNLPEPSDNAVSLKTSRTHDKLYINLVKSPNYKLQSQTQLIAHIRGIPVYAEVWDSTKNYLVFDKDFFPAGIVHFLLIDANHNILTERLVFSSQSGTFAKSNTQLDKDKYKPRDKINMSIKITDDNNEPLSGNVSIAVVDSKKTNLDTTSSIVSTLLLSSELKGYIENPVSYLQKNSKASELALDVLMMTQGWRRYDIPNLLKGNPVKDMKYPLELSEEVSGKAEGVFSTLKEGNLSLLALKDSVLGVSFTKPDKAGKFIFKNLEYPEGTKYIIQANTKTGSRKVFLEVDTLNQNPSFKNLSRIERPESVAEDYYQLKSANNVAIADDGLKKYELAEVTVTAKRKLPSMTESPYYSVMSSSVITTKEIDDWHLLTVYDLLRRIPGVTVTGGEVRYRGSTPMLLLDNVPTEGFDYDMLSVSDIQDAFVTPGTTMGIIFGSRGANGAIVINTKRGFVQKNTISSNIKYVKAIGYQQPTKFYSPTYEREQDRESGKPDYRTTIYWNPNIQIGLNGTANLSFFAADNPSDYIFIYEGVSRYGHLIHSSDKAIMVLAGQADK